MTRQYDNYADLITFTRASVGTYLDSDGVLKTATTNVPRIEYDADGNRLGLLIEEARTNILPYSEDFTQWTDSSGNITQTASGDISPDGGTNAYVVDDTGDGNDFIYLMPNVSADTTVYTGSLFVKKTVGDSHFMNIAIAFFGGTIAYGQGTFDTNLGVFTATQGNIVTGSALVQDSGDWWRISFSSANNGTGTSLQFRLYPAHNSDGTTNGNNATTGSKVVFGAQLEAGSFPTSYIPTAGAAATRAPDVASIPTSAFGYNQKAGTVVCEFSRQHLSTAYAQIASLDDGSTANRLSLSLSGGSGRRFRVDVNDNSVSQFANNAVKDGVTFPMSVALSSALNNYGAVADGGVVATDTSGTVPVVNQLVIGNRGGIDAYFNGHLKSLQFYPRRLTNAQLQELTA